MIKQLIISMVGCGAFHLCIFGPVLNMVSGKDWAVLGSGPVDTFLKMLGPFEARVILFSMIYAICIILYFVA